MTTRKESAPCEEVVAHKDVEEALHAIKCSHIEVDCYECREWVRDVNCDNILNQKQFETIEQVLQEKLAGGWLTDPTLAKDGDMVNLLFKDNSVRIGWKGTDSEDPELDFINEDGYAYTTPVAFQIITLPQPPIEQMEKSDEE